MALQAAYQQYLATPNSSFLAENASLHYITTLTTFNGATEIIKHLNTQSKKLKKKEEKVIDAVEGSNSIALETELTVEFISGGGAFLPGIDDNFLADRVVTFLVIHIVAFDTTGKITQIRQNWDQGSLLKLIDVIGKTGRNWPIRDGKDQIKLIQNSVAATEKPIAPSAAPSAAPIHKEGETLRRSRENSTNVTRDPHSTLSLFAPREADDESEKLPTVIAPRASAKPPPRDYHDLFVGQDSPENSNAPGKDTGPESPFKHAAVGAIAPKFGAGKNYHPSRIFDNDENDDSTENSTAPRRDSRTDAPFKHSAVGAIAPKIGAGKNYHPSRIFDNDENDDSGDTSAALRSDSPFKHSAVGAIAPKIGAGKNYHPSRIFESDENSPIRPTGGHKSEISLTKPNPKKYQHFDIGSGTAPGDTATAKNKVNDAPAPKSKHGSSWNFEDFNTPAKVVPTKGLAIRAQDSVHWGNENDEVPDSPIRKTRIDQPRKDAETHFEFQDDGVPEGQERLIGRPRGASSNAGLGLYKNNLYNEDGSVPSIDNQRAVGNLANVKDRSKDFDPHFTMTDNLNSPATKTEESQRPLGNIANVKDRRKDFDPHFTMTDDSPAPKSSNQKENVPLVPSSPSRAGHGPLSENTNPLASRDNTEKPRGIVIGGDGMGGKKGSGRHWGFGDDSDGEQEGGINSAGTAFSKGIAPKKAGSAAQTGGGDFWDF